MKTETRFNMSTVHLNNGKENCNHPMLQPALNEKGFHTGFYLCIKCGKQIQDNGGTLRIKELFF